MLIEWQKGLQQIDVTAAESVASFWYELAPGWELSANGMANLRGLLDRFGHEEVCEAMRIAANTYLLFEDNGKCEGDSWNLAFDKVGGICVNRRREKTDPQAAQLSMLAGFLRKRLSYVNESQLWPLLTLAVNSGIETQEIRDLAVRVGFTWSTFRDILDEWIEEADGHSPSGEGSSEG